MIDKRTRLPRTFKGYSTGALLGAITLGLLAGFILAVTLYNTKRPLLDPRPPEMENLDIGGNKPAVKKLVQSVEAKDPPCDFDPITYIRCSGERLGKTNREIMTMIRIARAESNFKTTAKNPKSSATGIFQITWATWDGNRCNGEKWDFVDNIDCGWKIQTRRGYRPWEVCNNGSVKCY